MPSVKEKIAALRQSGIRQSRVNAVLIAAAALIIIALLYAAYRTDLSFQRTQQAMERYMICRQDADLFKQASDSLTDEARSFVVTGDRVHVLNFVEELETARQREKMTDDAGLWGLEENSRRYLDEALNHSNELVQAESYALRLMIAGMDDDPADFPDQISSILLRDEDAALDRQAQKDAARDMLFSDAYNEKKRVIDQNVELSISALAENSRQEMAGSAKQFNSVLRRETVLIVVLLALVLSAVLLTTVLILRPLYRNIRHLDRREKMPVKGAYEMRHLARVYNDILAENAEQHEELSYTANHDALTGLYNRAAYEKAYQALRGSNVGVLVIDVDEFKRFNDTYGHTIGDLVLKRVAEALLSSFRSQDHISRIGGDEFCVIMRNAHSGMAELVRDKVRRINQVLAVPDQGTPSVSVSVGIAFWDRKNPTDDIFKDADTALYRIKGNGKSNCSVYE